MTAYNFDTDAFGAQAFADLGSLLAEIGNRWDNLVEGVDPTDRDVIEASRANLNQTVDGLHQIADALRGPEAGPVAEPPAAPSA